MTHHCQHITAGSRVPLPPREGGPHLRALKCVIPTKASDEVYKGRPTPGQPGVARIWAQRPALRRCQKLRRPCKSLAPRALWEGFVVGWFPWAVRGGDELVGRLVRDLERYKRARRGDRLGALDLGK